MNKKELELLLKEGEGYKTEFKESINNVDKDIVAFANSSGGRIFIGISDDGSIKGVKITNKIKTQIQDIVNNCRPAPKIFLEDFENILAVNVREGEDKPYECSSGFFKRIGPVSQKLKRDEIIDFFKSEGKVRFDELIEPKFDFHKDFDADKLQNFLALAGLSKAIGTEDILLNLGVAEKQEGRLLFNKAGILFFAKDPQKFIPWSVFTVVLFKNKEGTDVIDRKEISGSLFEIVDKVMDFVRLYAKVAYRFTGKPQREEIYEYPFEAVREAVINSVMHKDYFEHGHNNILKFFPDRIQIENIWVKPSHFILGKTVFRRNQLVCDLFSRIHFGEKIGSGMRRMKEICEAENAPHPQIEFTDTHFYVVFKQSKKYLKMAGKEGPEKWSEKWSEKGLTARQIEILTIVGKNPRISRNELSKHLKINPSAIQKHIAKLKKKGILKRIGPAKGGHWKISEEKGR